MPPQFFVQSIFALRSVRHLHSNPIEREVAGSIAGDIRDADTEIGEVAARPGASPRIGCTAEQVGGFACRQCGCGFSCRPRYPTVP